MSEYGYGSTRSGAEYRNIKNTGAPVTFGPNKVGPASNIYHGTQTKTERNANLAERAEQATGARWNVLDAPDDDGFVIENDLKEQLKIALKNATLNKQANQLTVCGVMGCVVYALTAAGAAFVAAKLAGLAGGNKSRRKRRNKSKRNKSKKNKRRSIRRR